jgi:hypothetical protein
VLLLLLQLAQQLLELLLELALALAQGLGLGTSLALHQGELRLQLLHQTPAAQARRLGQHVAQDAMASYQTQYSS